MAELEIDQSNLPRVQEDRKWLAKCFDYMQQAFTGPIIQYNSTEKDLISEEQDFEFARVIQEEIQRCAEEARRRERDDEEIAKQMQEEEEQRTRRRSRGQEGRSEVPANSLTHPPCFCVCMFGIIKGSASSPAPPSPNQHTLSSLQQGEEQYSSTATRWQRSTSRNHSNHSSGPQADSPRGVAAQKNTTSWSNEGHTYSIRQIRSELTESLSEDSEDLDTVFSEQLSVRSQRLNKKHNTAPPRRRASLHQPQERNYRSLCTHSSFTEEHRDREEERGEWDEDYYENGYLEKRRPRDRKQERNHREEYEGWYRSSDQDRDSRLLDVRERRCSRSESVRLPDRSRHSSRDLARTWTYKDNPDKHVRFQDNTLSSNRHQGESSQVWEMLGQVLRERGVPVRFGGNGAPLQIRPQSRDSQALHGSEVSHGDSQPHQRVFQRAATTRHSFHGDIRERRRLSYRENSLRDHREDRDRQRDDKGHDEEVYEISSRNSYLTHRERGGSRRWEEHRYTNDDERERNANDCRVKRTTSECRHWHMAIEERLSSEEEQEVERRVERPHRRASQRSQSLSSRRDSTRDRSRHQAAGVSPQPQPGEASLNLGELQQVLQDEELARKLQEEEEKVLRRRERLDSEGLPSPTEDCFPENQPPSPTSTILQSQQIRNIAEELDPTFQARRQGTENIQVGQTGPTCQSLPMPHSGLNDFLEEPTFIPPTKRQTDKTGRTKPKEKKENCKQQ
eukprot:superscaffoldBa00001653_g11469